MAKMAQWGPKSFVVSPETVASLENLSTAFALKQDQNNDTSGTPSTNTTGRELQQVAFECYYHRVAGVDPRAQIDEWNSLLGKANPLIIGGKRFGPAKLQLIGVDVSDITLTVTGQFLSARLAITLLEYAAQTTKVTTKKNKTTATASKPTSNTTYTNTSNTAAKVAIDEKQKAIMAKAKADQKEDLKPKR